MFELIKSILSYRGFILSSVKREFQSKYKNSVLGVAWNILNPLAMIIVYTVIFSQIMRTRIPGSSSSFSYSIYLCSGLLMWTLFSEIVLRSQNVFIENANFIKKINFPKICLPVIVIFNALVNFFMFFALFLIFLIISGNFPGVVILAYVPIILTLIIFAIGLGTTTGILNVFFRDVGQGMTILVQFWFWFTPVVYSMDILPPIAKTALAFNPVVGIITSCQKVMVNQQWPNWLDLLPALGTGILLVYLGLNLFRKHSSDMVDEL